MYTHKNGQIKIAYFAPTETKFDYCCCSVCVNKRLTLSCGAKRRAISEGYTKCFADTFQQTFNKVEPCPKLNMQKEKYTLC